MKRAVYFVNAHVAYGKACTGTVSFVSGRGTIALSQDGLKLKKGGKVPNRLLDTHEAVQST